MTKITKVENIDTVATLATVATIMDPPIKQKRGRKPKNVLITNNNLDDKLVDNNIVFLIQETNTEKNNNNDTNNDINNDNNDTNNDNNNNNDENNIILLQEEQKPGGKKRGRKPKGGKIIQQVVPVNNNKETKPNIILHLKCSLKDLHTNSSMTTNMESFHFLGKNDLNYEVIQSNNQTNILNNNLTCVTNCNSDLIINEDDTNDIYDDEFYSKNKENDVRDIWKKLKVLEHNLHINNISDKKSACFWCTYEFDNPPIYIPKHFIKNSYHVYGCFCSPECATAYLMEENIDSSSKFERYHLINHIYSKIYDYTKNIKPAPNPFYLLDKYYGNLSIQEYRSLLRNDRLFLIVDKPLTRILPELHEDNDDFIINNKIIPSNTLLIKKKLQKKQQPKNVILNEKFGLNQS